MRLAVLDIEGANDEKLKEWQYRSLYCSSWSAVTSRGRLSGVEVIGLESLISCAIGTPLEMWCLRAYLASTQDREWDIEVVLAEAPWLRDCYAVAGALVEELQRFKIALLACESESLARGLYEASKPRRRSTTRRFHVQLYNQFGQCVIGGHDDALPDFPMVIKTGKP